MMAQKKEITLPREAAETLADGLLAYSEAPQPNDTRPLQQAMLTLMMQLGRTPASPPSKVDPQNPADPAVTYGKQYGKQSGEDRTPEDYEHLHGLTIEVVGSTEPRDG